MPINLSLKKKLFILCFGLALIPMVVGALAYFGMNNMRSKYEQVTGIVLPNVQYSDNMYLNYRRVRIELRTLGIPGITKEDAAKAIQGVHEAIAEYEENAKMYTATPFSPGEREIYDAVHDSWETFKATGAAALKLYADGTPESHAKMIDIFFHDCPAKAEAYTAAMKKLVEFHRNNGHNWVLEAQTSADRLNMWMMVIIGVGVFLVLFSGYLFSNQLTHAIQKITTSLSEGAGQVNDASRQIASSAQNLSQSATQQASSLEETVATIEELSSMIKLNSSNAREASTLSTSTRDVASRGESEIKTLVQSIQEISADSKRIEEIITVIDDIAFQTNLLALNAAVEAARAGEQGKGFAVVADAVRNLAQRSASAAKDIATLIKNSVEKIEVGSRRATQSGEVFGEILNSVKKVSDLNSEIATASEEQSNGITQLSQAMNHLDQVTQTNASASEQAAAAAEELAGQSSHLTQNVKDLSTLVDGRRAA